MNSLYKIQELPKQNGFWRQSHCVATSNRHVHFLSLVVTRYEYFIARKVAQRPQVKLKRSEIRFCDYCNFLPRLAVFTLETESETAYPLDKSPHILIWKWNGLNFGWTIHICLLELFSIVLSLKKNNNNNKKLQWANATAIRVCCKWIHP